MNYYIFGAHSRARTLAEYLRRLQPDMELAAYLYDNDEPNANQQDGVPVIRMGASASEPETRKKGTGTTAGGGTAFGLDTTCPVYLATRGVFHTHATEVLKLLGFTDIRPVTPELDASLRNAYVQEFFAERGLKFRKLSAEEAEQEDDPEEKPTERKKCMAAGAMDGGRSAFSACIFVAKSAVDKPLHEDWTPLPGECILQVGASLDKPLTDAAFFDNTGGNISDLNRQFCELTGFYWIWKNATDDIAGLCHYRRHFLLPDNWADQMRERGIDILLPVPLYVAPSLAENYRERHVPAVWETMMAILAEQNPQEARDAESFFEKNGLYCPCNMLIAKKEVFNRLSAWLFPIILETQKRIGTIDDSYQNRYPGFLSERLISFWCYEHREEYSIWFADKNFLV